VAQFEPSNIDDPRAGQELLTGREAFSDTFLFDTLPDPVFLCACEATLESARICRANDAALSYMKYTTNQLYKYTLGDLVNLQNITTDQLRRLREGRTITFETSWRPHDDGRRPIQLHLSLRTVDDSSVLCAVCKDLAEHRQLEEKADRRRTQQAAITEIARLVLTEANTSTLLKNIARKTTRPLDVSYAAILKHSPDANEMRLVAGCGWPKSYYDTSVIPVRPDIQEGYTLQNARTVRVEAFASEDRFHPSDLLQSQQIQSCLSTVIPRSDRPYGVLMVASSLESQFEPCDEAFVEHVAALLGELLHQQTAKQALRRSETKYRRLFNDSRDALFIVAPDGEILAANPAAHEMFGYEAWEVKAQDLYVDPSDRLEFRQQLEAQGFIEDFETKMKHRDGTEMHCLMTSTARWNAEGHAEAYQTIVRDITAHKRAEEALRASEERFRTFTEKALVGVYIVQEGQFRYVNPRFAEIFDYSVEKVLREKSPLDLIDPDDHSLVAHHIRERLEGRTETAKYTCRGLTRHGQSIHVEVYGTRIQHEGQPAILGTAIDITERRRLEREILQVSEDERRRIGQDLHDGLGQMLTGIGMMAQNLSQALKKNDSDHVPIAEEISNLIHEADRHAHELAHGLTPVDLSTGGLPTALEQLSVRTEQLFDIECDVTDLESVPIDDTTIATNLYRIAQEAITNAVKHGNARKIELALQQAGNQLRLMVRDDGSGFSPRSDSSPDGGMGIDLMEYRARIIGGTLNIRRLPEGGTALTCSVFIS
jgi:PAS domain S-box-containing protein